MQRTIGLAKRTISLPSSEPTLPYPADSGSRMWYSSVRIATPSQFGSRLRVLHDAQHAGATSYQDIRSVGQSGKGQGEIKYFIQRQRLGRSEVYPASRNITGLAEYLFSGYQVIFFFSF